MDKENGSILKDEEDFETMLRNINFNNLDFKNVQELEEIVTPGNGSICCC